MSGIFGASQLFFSGAGDFYGFPIENSLRLNRGDSANLERTPSSAGSRQTHTISMWVKRSELGRTTRLFMATNNSSNATFHILEFNSDDTIRYYAGTEGSSAILNVQTNAVYRDVSAWYHIVAALDSTQATSSNRAKLYVNGTQITDLKNSTYGSQNAEYRINNTNVHYINKDGSSLGNNFSTYYVAEVNFIDGQQLNPDSFGETKSGVWIAKQYTGSYGSNGFRLAFGDSSNIGDDTSGNTNDFTPVNLQTNDVVPDSPNNNFATLNPLITASTYGQQSAPDPTDGNVSIQMAGGTNNIAVSNFELIPPNKYRCQFTLTTRGSSTNFEFGIGSTNKEVGAASVRYNSSGTITVDATTTQTGLTSANTVGDAVEVLVDLNANNVKFALKENGTSTWAALGTAENISANVTNPIVWVREQGSNNINGTMDFGQFGYVGSDDNNYNPMSTLYLPEPSITPLNDDIPEDYFNTVIYDGDSADRNIEVGFKSDFTWVKHRNSSGNHHRLYNIISGEHACLFSSSTSAISTATDGIAFDFATGFNIDDGANRLAYNQTSNTYVSWNWLAGGTGVSNTDGGRNSTVSANQEAGFSIVKYTGDNTTASVGHGLGAIPDMIIVKCTGLSNNWVVFHTALGADAFINLNLANADSSTSGYWGTPSTTTFGVHGTGTGGNNRNGEEHIAYCFTSIEGYSKFGSYIGNGSSDGTYVYVGFRPAFVMIKNTDASAGWMMYDSKRGTNVGNEPTLSADTSDGETTSGDRIDFTSNGFKLKVNQTNVNLVNDVYIYMAFAEMPFKYANAV